MDACRTHQAEVLILDDGFQHRRLFRDLDIVLVDALDPWGAEHLLPRGLLREPRSSLKRAGLVVLTRADQCAAEEKEQTLAEICAAWAGQLPVEAIFRPVGLINAAAQTASTDALGDAVAAFCGIGNPEGFRRTLDAMGVKNRLAGFRAFDDHHHYQASDLEELTEWARSCGASALVTTQKDLVKIPRNELGGLPLWAVMIRTQITARGEEFDSHLQRLIETRVKPNCSKFQ
jgi:tetraacyldisaccharide 4'-kinase